MAHQEISVTFTGNSAQIMHLGPLELKGGETKYLPIKNDIATLAQLKKIGSLSVKEVTVADKDDKVEELGKDVVVKEVKKRYFVTYVGKKSEESIKGFKTFYRDDKEIEIDKDMVERFKNNDEFVLREILE